MVAAGCDQHIGPDGIDDARCKVDRETQRRRFQHHRRHHRRHRLPDDQQRGNDDQHALDDGGKVLRLVVPEGMAGIRRLRRIADHHIGDHRGNHIDGGLKPIGQKRHRAGQPPGKQLQPQDGQRKRNAPEGKAQDGSVFGSRQLLHSSCRCKRVANASPLKRKTARANFAQAVYR
ncbi:hypothetical protein D3C72_1650540 [compost metagenome]